ncbi:MAG TPA: polysaccharide biosynthesis tyrosine autokinase [Longimicrobium sp.]|nr:polysaccharide biosynthesis tyrosine autokinase [Longimicrobium sp.]
MQPDERAFALPAARITPEAPPADVIPDADGMDLREMLGVLRRQLKLIVAVAAICTALAFWYANSRPPRFKSDARLRISDMRRGLTGGIEEQAMERISGYTMDPVLSQIEVLRSRSIIGRAVDMGSLRLRTGEVPARLVRDILVPPSAPTDTLAMRFEDSYYQAAGRAGTVRAAYGQPVNVGGVRFTVASRPGVPDAMLRVVSRDRAVNEVLGGLSAKPQDRTDVVQLRFESRDPVRAERVLAAVVETFQQVNTERAQQQSRRRRVFVEEQMRVTDSVLAVAQLELSRFQQQQQAFSSTQRFSAEQESLTGMEQRRNELAAERGTYAALLGRVLRSRTDEDAAALRALAATPGVASNPVVAQLYGMLARHESARDSLLSGPNPRAPTDPEIQRLNSQIATAETRIADAVRSQIASIDARLVSMDAQRAGSESRIRSMPDAQVQEVRLTQQMSTVQGMADQLREEYQKARISEAVEVGQVEVLDVPSPATPIGGGGALVMLLGLVGGLGLGAASGVLREQLNTTVRSREEMEQLLGVPGLAVIPSLAPHGSRGLPWRRELPAAPEPGEVDLAVLSGRSAGAEAYRTLRTNLIFSQATGRLKVLVVTSAVPGEGKSTTVSNLAAAFAQQGMRVLLVDCDLRRARQHSIFAMPREPGLTQLVLGHAPLAEVARPTAVENLFLLAAGTLPPNPAELLGSERMQEVTQELREAFDLVVFDTPPVLAAADGAILAAGADGVVLVVRAGRTARGAAQQALRQLTSVGGRVLGAVLNDPDERLPAYGGYGKYGYYYYSAYAPHGEPSPNGRKSREREPEREPAARV